MAAIAISVILLFISGVSVNGQITTPCTSSMITSFTPCFNFITGSSSTGSTPTADCCNALKELTSTSRDCTCLIINAGVPVSIPLINRTLAISLPRACNMPGVPIQCKATGSPLPAPGPASLGPAAPPTAAAESPLSPTSSKATTLPPVSSNEAPTESPPALSPGESDTPTTSAGIKPVLTPSAATNPSFTSNLGFFPLSLLVAYMVY